MNNYFKVYLQRKDGSWIKEKVKTKKEVNSIIEHATYMNYYRYQVVKRIKENVDVLVANGYFSKKAKIVLVDNLETDYKIVAGTVMIDDKGKLIKEREEER